MNLLNVEQVSKSFTERLLLDGVTFGIEEGDRIGVIGINGTGKSTLLQIIAGVTEPDEGQVVKGSSVTVEYVAQQPVFDEEKSVLTNVITGRRGRGENWNVEGEAKALLKRFAIEDPSCPMKELSGGQKKRAALVRTLLDPSDILVLDEPTNHLDAEMTEWLEEHLADYPGAVVLVTHDRYFLDRVSNHIFELDRGRIYRYETDYTGYLELKAEREAMEAAAERKARTLYRKDLEWMLRGARARSTKQKAHIRRFEQLRDREKPAESRQVEMSSAVTRLGGRTVEAEGLAKSYGEKVLFTDFSYIFLKGDRIGIVGPNGCGKTTLLRVLLGLEKPDAGSVSVGQTVKMSYFAQENEPADPALRVIDYIRDTAEYVRTAEGIVTASAMCERFLFDKTMQYARIEKLSGGEKRRLYLLKTLMEAPNVLVLDEPTNDLDIETLQVLEDYLDSFEGIVISVSHDRYFLDRTCRRLFAFEEGGRIRQHEGGYSDYRLCVEEESRKEPEEPAAAPEKAAYVRSHAKKKTLSFKDQREYETLPGEIEALEAQSAAIATQIEQYATDAEKLAALVQEQEELQARLEERMERWLTLEEMAEALKNED
ncbi:MAG: ABC-F family ATP-binding cassette domain-containing protein [Lachnospiraceae bacterium]|nr:ABC-F family ATP-binding cassette domain-containing protein [Lachnospiraceae bacterium]